jgi:hypothetical protein
MEGRICILINTKDRPSEISLLLQGLRTQTYQDFDIAIMDDGGGTPLLSYAFLNTIIMRMKYEGHNILMYRNPRSIGVSLARQKLVDHALEDAPNCEYFLRIDDDTIPEPDYIQKLVSVIDAGYDLASGITTPAGGPLAPRDPKIIMPYGNRVVLNAEGGFKVNGDDFGHSYIGSDELIIPCHHFRSSALYNKSVHTEHNVNYEDTLTMCGFREEQFFSFRMMLKGLTLGVHLGANHFHLLTPSGGDRRGNYQDLAGQNQLLLNRWVKRMFREHGDFIEKYNRLCEKKHGTRTDTEEDKYRSLHKKSNLIYHSNN